MKKALSMLVALAMVLTLVVAVAPVTNAASTTVCEVTDLAVTSDEPYIWTWEATGDGTLDILATPSFSSGSVNAAFKVNIYANEAEYLAESQPSIMEMGSYQTPGDMWFEALTTYDVSQGNYVVVELVAQKAYTNTDGTVSMIITFSQGTIDKVESEIDWNTVLDLGQNDLTLNETAYHTLYLFEPDEIGVYTLSVNEGATIGYWGAGTFFYNNPNSTATSIEREIKQVGQEMLIGISSEDPNVVLTIEKTGESGGIIEVVYIDWENTHTPTSSLAGGPSGTLTSVDINEPHDAVLGADGFYHLDNAAGPVLYVDLISQGFNILSCYGLDGEGGQIATRLRGEYNGEHYEFITAMREYANVLVGSNGNYPLTEDLLAFVKGYGEGQAWYNPDLSSFPEIADREFDEDTAWMVTLSYVEGEVAPHECVKSEDYTEEYADDYSYFEYIWSCEICGEPMETERWYFISDSDDNTADVEYTASVAAGETGNLYGSYSIAGTVLVLEEGDFTLTIDGVVQTPVEGYYVCEFNSYYGTEIQITNNGSADAEYELVFAVPVGSPYNPDSFPFCETDEITFTADSTDGYYYVFTAPCDGTVTVTVGGEFWQFYVNNAGDPDDWYDDVWGETHCYDDAVPVNTESIAVVAGQQIELFVATMAPGDYWTFVDGTVTVTAGFVHASTDGLEYVPADPATHTEPGNEECYVCYTCGGTYDAEGNLFDAIIPATGHTTAVHVPEVPATEEADGMEEHWYCAECDAYFTDAECTNEVERDDLVITYIPETGDMSIAALALALMAATAGAVVLAKKKEF